MESEAAWQGFNCVDFRHTLKDDGVANMTAPKCRHVRGDACDYFRNWPLAGFVRGKRVQNPIDEGIAPDLLLSRIVLSRTVKNAYLGIQYDSFGCQQCPDKGKDQVVAYLRGEDIFADNVHARYGQPPLDYYIKAIDIATSKEKASEVVIVSYDRANPVVDALEVYLNTTSRRKDEISVVSEIGLPYVQVLKRMYCAKSIILGFSTMNGHIADGNAQSVFHPRRFNESNNCGVRNSVFLSQPEKAAKWIDTRTSYVYNRHDYKYSVVDSDWTNSPDQLQEMLSFVNGTIQSGHIDMSKIGCCIIDARTC